MSGHSKWHNIAQKKGKADAARANVFTKTSIAGTKASANELTDEDIKSVIQDGCHVSHKKYGKGIVKTVNEGKIDVLFENSVEKVFAAKVCINNGLLTVI